MLNDLSGYLPRDRIKLSKCKTDEHDSGGFHPFLAERVLVHDNAGVTRVRHPGQGSSPRQTA
jgi:hypothetical protein